MNVSLPFPFTLVEITLRCGVFQNLGWFFGGTITHWFRVDSRLVEAGDIVTALRKENCLLKRKASVNVARQLEREVAAATRERRKVERLLARAELRLRRAVGALAGVRGRCTAAAGLAADLAADLSAVEARSEALGRALASRRARHARAAREEASVRRMEGRGIHVQVQGSSRSSSRPPRDDDAPPQALSLVAPCDACETSNSVQRDAIDAGLAACDHAVKTLRRILDVAVAGVPADHDEVDELGDAGDPIDRRR